MNLKDLAELTGCTIERGLPDMPIAGAAGLDIAGHDQITFLSNPRYTSEVEKTKACAIFVDENEPIGRKDIAILRSEDPRVAYTLALRAFHPDPPITAGLHETALIDASSRIADGVQIDAYVVIGQQCVIEKGVRIYPGTTIYDGVHVGAGTVIHSGVSVRANTAIGKNCVIQNNSTIGADGFGYARTPDKKWMRIPHTGRIVIEDDVEIGANTSIDRASVGESRIKRGAKIDNLVQIGHSCTIGEDSLICSQTGLAGTSVIGDRVILAGQVGIAGHLTVGDDVTMTAKSATSHDVADGKIMSGVPAFENRDWLRATAAFRRLGDMAKKLRMLEKRLEEIEKEVETDE